MKLSLKDARTAGVPLVAIETSDPAQTINTLLKDLNGGSEKVPIMRWDIVTGLDGLNPLGSTEATVLNGGDPKSMCEPVACLVGLAKSNKEDALAFLLNIHRFWNEPQVMQAIWNLRDLWKSKGSTLVLLCPTASLPEELKSDVVVMTEEVPTDEEINRIVESVAKDAGVPIKAMARVKIVDTLLGYPTEFAVEQATALGLNKTGADIPAMQRQRMQAMKTLAGLEITLPEENFSNLAGCAGIKSFCSAYLTGRKPPRVVFWLDEIEKMVAGSGTDTSGVTQALLEQFLFWTESEKVDAMLLLGVPGAGKSWTTHCTAGEAQTWLCRGSMSTVKGSLVGQSEQQMRTMLKAVSAIGQGRILMMATCNSIDGLPPEVIARFKLGTFFYTWPSKTELDALWKLYIQKYELKDKPPVVEKWVGREVESCCHRAWLFRSSLAEAAKTVVPVSMASAAKMELLQKSADGRFNSASRIGVYRINEENSPELEQRPARKMGI